jgi:membrane-bound lytic murein transglycosylase D
VSAPARPTAPPARDSLACIEHPRIDAWEERLRSDPHLRRTTEQDLARGRALLPRLERIVGEAGLPRGLALIPLVESGFRLDARGQRGERGLWQLKPASARGLGLVVSGKADERLDPERATRAAARHLASLYGRYDDWPLALAAYTAGHGRVDRARAERPNASFWELADQGRLPRASRDFVAHVLAAVRLKAPAQPCRLRQETAADPARGTPAKPL